MKDAGIAPSVVSTASVEMDDLRELMLSVTEVTTRLQGTHDVLQAQVQQLQAELSDANAQLQRSRSLAALGEMAAGIAHEIRNPLGSIALYVQMLSDDVAESSEQRELCSKINRAAGRMNDIVRDVLAFARHMQIDCRPVQTAALFADTLEHCEALRSQYQVECSSAVAVEAEVFQGDESLLQQALGNLVRNAIEAIAADGRSDGHVHLEAVQARRRLSSGLRSDCTVLTIRDNGPGIPREVVERMFNPFFTTRATGTGLGLAIVHRIVDIHGGTVTVVPNPQEGASIELALPGSSALMQKSHHGAV